VIELLDDPKIEKDEEAIKILETQGIEVFLQKY